MRHDEALIRMKKIEGQVKGIIKMLEDEKYCIDVLHQISAVIGALKGTSTAIMRRHVEGCVKNAVFSDNSDEKNMKMEELIKLFDKFI